MPNEVPEGYEIKYTEDNLPYYQKIENIPVEPSDYDPFARAAARVRNSVKGGRLPIEGPPAPVEAPGYLIEPDLLEAQQGQHLPTGIAVNDAGIPFNLKTGVEIPTVPRPNVLPVAKTPEGLTFAMPKMLDVVGNVMSPMIAGKVPVKAGEMVLGSGMVKTTPEIIKETGPFYSALERAVDSAKLGKGSAEQWLGYLKNQPGVKSEELNYVLGDLKGQLTKAEVQDIVKQNKVGFEEKVLGKQIDPDTIYEQAKNYVEENYKQYKIGSDNYNLAIDEKVFDLKKELAEATKYHEYQLPGGENYQELLFKLPTKRAKVEYQIVPNKDGVNFDVIRNIDGNKEDYLRAVPRKEAEEAAQYGNKNDVGRYSANTFKSSHFDDDGTNLLAHVRMNDRMVDGKKTLHIEEIQSDWHQKGRKEGYIQKDLPELKQKAEAVDEKLIAANAEDIMANPDLKEGLKQAVERKIITQKEADDYLRLAENEHSTVPDAPFKKSWEELTLKRMLHKAATEGYEGLSITPGEAQALRYQNEIRRKLDGIDYIKQKGDERLINIQPTDGTDFNIRVDKQGTIIEGHPELKGKKLDDAIGKDLAKQIMEGNDGHINTKGYVMGAEGMKQAYDKRAVDILNNIAKKYGSKVESRDIKGERVFPDVGDAYDEMYKIHYLPITPELRAKAKEGFPLFSSVPVTVPVDYDPWEKKKVTLVPVNYDPFK